MPHSKSSKGEWHAVLPEWNRIILIPGRPKTAWMEIWKTVGGPIHSLRICWRESKQFHVNHGQTGGASEW